MSSTTGLIVMLIIFGLYGYFGERAEARERRRGRAITAPQRLDDTQTSFRSPTTTRHEDGGRPRAR